MVRIRSKRAKALEVVSPSPNSLRKRKSGESAINGQQPAVSGSSVPSRASKRTRVTHLPYQSPASVDAMIVAVTRKKPSKIEETPKRKIDSIKAPRRPSKPLKRLQKGAKAKQKTPNPSVRRKLLKSPVPAKSKRKSPVRATAKGKLVKKIPKKSGNSAVAARAKPRGTPKTSIITKKRKATEDESAPDPSAKLPPNADSKDGKRVKAEPKRKKGKLQPKPNLTNHEKDPTFESKAELPFISTLSHSRLLIRAVMLNDMKLLKKLIQDEPQKIYTLRMTRSSTNTETVLDYILKNENKEAFKILHKIPSKLVEKFGSSPTLMISEEGSGQGSYMMFGHGLRQVSVGRGGKEGNNAFLYDKRSAYHLQANLDFNGSEVIKQAVNMGASPNFVDFLMEELKVQTWDYYNIYIPLRKGHYELVGKAIAKANLKGGYGFNFLHEEALTKKTPDSLTPFKPISVTKKCTYNPRFAPLHCAAINPNVGILTALLRSMPDFNLADTQGWTVGHYAAVCCGPEPLKYLLLQFGISTDVTTSTKRGGDGYTLLHAAISAGRVHNVKLILEHEEKNSKNISIPDDDDDGKGKKKAGLIQNDIRYKLTTKGQNGLHMACELGHLEIVRMLLNAGVDANRPTLAKYDRVTPLMIASMYGHIDVVKVLVEAGVKVDAKDKRGRTAAHHAAMNGHTHVLSYLLRLGVNHLAVDSSGNTLLHYSAAYGWYFATMLLLEAGCPPNASNFWKMTPMAIAFMKGHTGLVTELMKQDGVDVNARIDENGRTLFLEICNAGLDIGRLKFLVEDLKADPTCEDFKGNNALHYMAHKQFKEYMSDYQKTIQSFYKCITYLVENGCDPLKQNLDGSSPILKAAQCTNFHFVSKLLLELGIQLPYEKGDSDNTFLHYMSHHFTQSDHMVHSIFSKLCEDETKLEALTEMANTFNKEGFTPLLQLLNTRLSIPNEEFKVKIFSVLDTFFGKLNVDVNAKFINKKSPLTALHLAIGSDILEAILKYKPLLDPLDEHHRTPLVIAVTDGHHEAAEKLIDAGANVNFKIKSENGIGLLLLASMKETKSFYLIPKLIAKGADAFEIHQKTKNSVLHYIARRPTLKLAAEALSAVLSAGVNPNLTNCDGRTALHLSINSRGSETDVFYDIEDVLITAGADLTIRDHRGRIPLHYAFVKVGNPTDATFFDPIELVSHLVTSMKSSGATSKIHSVDVYGSSALHYSAFRGATICSSYLIQTLKHGEIDMCDNNGNTPFGLAVRNAHEGCALNFYQKDANFLRTINNNIKVQELRTEEATVSSPNGRNPATSIMEPWKWTYKMEEDEEKEMLREERERYPILEQVVKHDWQGMLYLMIGQLQSSGVGFSTGIATALKTQRLKLALKLSLKVKQKKELTMEAGTLFHTLAKHYEGGDEDLVMKICETFRKNGLDPTAVDEFGSQAVIYALANHQHKLCDMILPKDKDVMKILASMRPDLFGRTPFNALFWTMKKVIPFNIPLQKFAEQLISAGANPNELCEYPFSLTSYPGVRTSEKLVNIIPSNNGTRYSPLITAVIMKCYATVKWLLTVKLDPVNINTQDTEGRTALMHAVRLNDIKMVKLLLDPVNYEYLKDREGKILPKMRSCKADFTIRDKKGQTVMDHLILSPGNECYYKNFHQIFNMFQSMKAVNITSGDGLAPLDRAIKHKRNDIVQMLSKHVPLPANKKALLTWHNYSEFTPTFSQDIVLSPIQDFTTAAEKMAEKLVEEDKKKRQERGEDDNLKPQPDPLCGLEKDNAEVMIDPQQNIPYECLMTKVDINYGMYGLYNFYKMQLIRQPRGKEMILLFTQWGRVGTSGQFQKTPFATEEEAIKEFTKIFRSKSGNAWEDVQNFNAIPSKYRLVKKDLRLIKHSTEAKLDFDGLDKAWKAFKSTLPRSITSLIRNLSLVHRDAGSNYSSGGFFHNYQTKADYDSLPFLPLDVLVKGENLLKEIGDRIQKKEEMDRDGSGKYTEKDKLEIMNDIVKFSEEFYSIIPVFGYSTEKLEPIFLDHDLRQKLIDISRLLHLGLAKSLLLAAQFHQSSTNPFEYIYRCLGTKIQLLDRANSIDKFEADLILQHIYNTGENVKVHGIYRVDIPSENSRLNATNIQNRQLLWHGTSAANMLSILQQGLKVAPLSAQISGALFGKGVYLADMFAKSQHYCRSGAVNGNKCRKYMLLCEAALGKIWEVKLYEASQSSMPAGYDSLKTLDSRYEPDPESTVLWKGRTVALGTKKEKYYEDSWGWGLDYNEYIVFNVDQVAVRYLIEFED